jgi:hypothetical protein
MQRVKYPWRVLAYCLGYLLFAAGLLPVFSSQNQSKTKTKNKLEEKDIEDDSYW